MMIPHDRVALPDCGYDAVTLYLNKGTVSVCLIVSLSVCVPVCICSSPCRCRCFMSRRRVFDLRAHNTFCCEHSWTYVALPARYSRHCRNSTSLLAVTRSGRCYECCHQKYRQTCWSFVAVVHSILFRSVLVLQFVDVTVSEARTLHRLLSFFTARLLIN